MGACCGSESNPCGPRTFNVTWTNDRNALSADSVLLEVEALAHLLHGLVEDRVPRQHCLSAVIRTFTTKKNTALTGQVRSSELIELIVGADVP